MLTRTLSTSFVIKNWNVKTGWCQANDLTLGYQNIDSARSSKFHHLALHVALVSHSLNYDPLIWSSDWAGEVCNFVFVERMMSQWWQWLGSTILNLDPRHSSGLERLGHVMLTLWTTNHTTSLLELWAVSRLICALKNSIFVDILTRNF